MLCICTSGPVNITARTFPADIRSQSVVRQSRPSSPLTKQVIMCRLTRSLLSLLLLATIITTVLGRPGPRARCDFGARASPPPGDCGVQGWVMTPCGGRVCKKGPGDVCGGSQGQYGVCGEGLQCSECNRSVLSSQTNNPSITIISLCSQVYGLLLHHVPLLLRSRQVCLL